MLIGQDTFFLQKKLSLFIIEANNFRKLFQGFFIASERGKGPILNYLKILSSLCDYITHRPRFTNSLDSKVPGQKGFAQLAEPNLFSIRFSRGAIKILYSSPRLPLSSSCGSVTTFTSPVVHLSLLSCRKINSGILLHRCCSLKTIPTILFYETTLAIN